MTTITTPQMARRRTRFLPFTALALYGILTIRSPALAADPPPPPPVATVTYARLADLVIASPAIARARIKSVVALKPERAPDVSSGQTRFYVEAETIGLIRGDSVIARKIGFLIDGPSTKAKKPGLKGREVLLFGKVGPQVDQLQLTSSSALLDWNSANEALVRKVMTDTMAQNIPPAIKGITSAFHQAGAIRGESETQIFLETVSGTPISLSIIRRPDEKPHFSASLGEIVDEAASIPEPETMLWYRLACGLPQQMPARALRELPPADARAATVDYTAFREALSPCEKTATPVL